MKNVTVKMPHCEASWILIKTADELLEYFEYTSNKVVEQTKRLIKSDVEVNRWDHMITKSHEGSILAANIIDCQFNGKNPILNMDSIMQLKFNNMLADLMKGRELLVNSVGGYCFMAPEFEILGEEVFDTSIKPTHTINENTKYINLENDPELEKRTVEFLSKLDENYSYILNLHHYSEEALVEVFTQFKANGGQFVHVYTTGFNVPQMYSYHQAALTAGLVDFVFEFNSGITEGIQGFIEHAKKSSNVTIVDN